MIKPRPTQSAMDQAVEYAYEDGFAAGLRHSIKVVHHYLGDGNLYRGLSQSLIPETNVMMRTWIREEKES